MSGPVVTVCGLLCPGGGVLEGRCWYLPGEPRARGARLRHAQEHRGEAEFHQLGTDPGRQRGQHTGERMVI